MKVALIDVNYGSGSTGKIVADLLEGLSRKGHDVFVFYGRGQGRAGEPRAKRISSLLEVVLHGVSTRLTGFTDGFSPVATRRLIGELKRLRPDVVHLHDIHGYFVDIPVLCRYLKCSNIATVWTFHCEFMYTGRCGYAMDCEGWKTGCNSCPDLSRYPSTWFFDFAGRMYSQKREIFAGFRRLRLVAPSAWMAFRMRESMVGDKPIDVVPNGLNTRIFRPRDARALREELGVAGRYCVLSVGADLMSPRKGGHWVLELAKRFPREDVVFIMVGVERIPASVPKGVRILPRIESQNRLAELYSLGDVLMLPSHKETFSMVTAEALSCGTPVVGFDSGAPQEVAPEGYGSFVSYGDLDALEALVRAASIGQAGLRSSADCVAFAQSQYSHESMVLKYETIYQEAIDII